MKQVPHFNGSVGTLRRPPVERYAHETLHDFLLRRHDEMSAELGMLHSIVERQALTLRCERLETLQYENWLIVGQAWIAVTAAAACWFCIPGDLFYLAISTGLASMIGGVLILRLPSALERAVARLRSWRRR